MVPRIRGRPARPAGRRVAPNRRDFAPNFRRKIGFEFFSWKWNFKFSMQKKMGDKSANAQPPGPRATRIRVGLCMKVELLLEKIRALKCNCLIQIRR